MNRPTQSRSKIGYLVALVLPVVLAACGAQANDAATSQTAFPTFSKDRVAQEAPVEVRRMLSGSEGWSFETSSPSPDGRYLTDIKWIEDAGSSLLDLETGEETQIPNQLHTGWTDTGSAFSPDGSRVAHAYWGSTGYEVRSIGVDGADPRVHLQYAPSPGEEKNRDDFAEVADWSKDGQYLLVNAYPGEVGSHLATIDVTTNEYRILKTVDTQVGISFFSPDDRFVAYDVYARDSPERDIFLVSSDGSQETTLTRTPDYERLLGWLPDGSGILFHRDAEDSQAIWKLPLNDGQPTGPPELVKDDVWDMTGFGFSDDAYFYGVTVSRRGVVMASFDLETGQVLEAMEPVSDPPGLFSRLASWSPDGTRIVYFSAARGRNNQSQPTRIIVRSLTGEVLQDLPSPLQRPRPPVGWTAHGLVVWDNAWVATEGTRARAGTDLVSLETGEATSLGKQTGGYRRSFTVSDDGSSFFNGERPAGPDDAFFGPIYEYDLTTGSERVIVEETARASSVGFPDAIAGIMAGNVSPDGDKILYYVALAGQGVNGRVGGRGLEIFSRSTGESRVLGRLVDLGPDYYWSRDGRYVVANGHLEDPETAHLLRISVEDGSVISLAESPENFDNVSLSPDGRHISWTTGETRQEIWRMTFNSGR